jgi:hypothetical protein
MCNDVPFGRTAQTDCVSAKSFEVEYPEAACWWASQCASQGAAQRRALVRPYAETKAVQVVMV